MRHLMIGAALLVLVVVGAALWIDEGEVVTLRTTGAEGHEAFETELWIVEYRGALYLRGAHDRAWIARLRAHPRVELVRGGRTLAYEARPIDDPEVVAGVEAAMAAKYGSADQLSHRVFDRSAHLAIRLDPVEMR